MIYNCDCSICNTAEEEHQVVEQEYVEWHYKQYCKETKNPLSMDEWLESLVVQNKE